MNNAAIIRDEMMGRTRFWEEPINVIDTSTSDFAAVTSPPSTPPR